MSLETFLESLTDPTYSTLASDFIEVSDLSPAELGKFARTWFSLPLERQRQLMETMVDLTEDNPELDFSAIFKMTLKDKDEAVLEKAMEGLWEHEDRTIIPGLIQILQSDRSPRVRSSAANALGKFSVLAEEGKLLTKDANLIRENLMHIVENGQEDQEVRRRSLEAVAPFNTLEIRKYITQSYESPDINLKSSSIFAMGRTGETSWLPLLLKELKNPEPAIRYEAANACGELGEEDVVAHLIPLLDDDDYQVQLASVTALGKIGGPLSKKVLLHCIKEGDATLEEAAQAALENIQFLEDPMSFTHEL